MNVHISVDDVILSLIASAEENPDSIIDIPFFKCLYEFHNLYGTVFTLYAFEGFGNSFHISQVPQKYWLEMETLGFLKFGYHGSNRRLEFSSFVNEFDRFYTTIPKMMITRRLRLHRYQAEYDKVSFLRERGVIELLCRDDESKARLQSGPSYDLDSIEMSALADSPLLKNGIIYRKTGIQIDLYNLEMLAQKLKIYIEQNKEQDTLVLFIHERFLPEQAKLLDEALRYLAKSGASFIF